MTCFRLTIVLAVLALLGSVAVQAADFNRDGKADVLWRLPKGNPVLWQMGGLAVQSRTEVPNALGADAAILGAGSFFPGSEAVGVAWITSDNRLRLWALGTDGDVLEACAPVASVPVDWEFLGVGDINGDGVDDVVGRTSTNKQVLAYLMNGCATPEAQVLSPAVDEAWVFAGLGDLDGTGTADLLWLHNGHLIVWFLAGETVTEALITQAAQFGWTVEAVADFNADSKADLLWRRPGGNDLVVWRMDGATPTVATIVPSSTGVFAPADTVFSSDFDGTTRRAPPLAETWTILRAADFNGDGRADLLLVNVHGEVAIWQMRAAQVDATSLPAPELNGVPLPGLDGWRLPLERPVITTAGGSVRVEWKEVPGNASYLVYGSEENDPAVTGSIVSTTASPLEFARSGSGFGGVDRYFSVSAKYHGIALPRSLEAYIVEFDAVPLPYWGAMSVNDLNRDGCQDIATVLGDCHGGFTVLSEPAIGMAALRANGRAYRDVRFADFNGDGIPDAIANVYACDVDGCGGNDENSKILMFIGQPGGTFVEDTEFTGVNSPGGGFGETIVVADFNNDGCLDVFLPKYTAYDASEHNFLLINDCHGHFIEIADAAGVAQRSVPLSLRPEGAQALDINNDGWVDLYCASQLFINNGDLTFTNVGNHHSTPDGSSVSPWGLPAQFDEGAKFIDLDNSGQLSLVLNTANTLRVFKFNGIDAFVEQQVMPNIYMNASWGLTATDVDGDGRADLIVAGGIDQTVETRPEYANLKNVLSVVGHGGDMELDTVLESMAKPNAVPQLLVNRGSFVVHDFFDDGKTPETRAWNDLQTFGDFDASGTMDVVTRFYGQVTAVMNKAQDSGVIAIRVVGAAGERNQQGRVVRVSPLGKPEIIMTQVVDSGSGYMSNGPYDLAFSTPYPGLYEARVRFAGGTVTTTLKRGMRVAIHPDGRVTEFSK